MSERVKVYWIRIMGPDERTPEDEEGALEAVSGAISEAEENISDLLPEGYYAKIDEVKIT